MRKSKTKELPRWVSSELELLEWKTVDVAGGVGYVKDGVLIQIVPLGTNKQYHVTYQKMSERKVMLLNEPQLLQLIEGETNE
jgi:prophage antirepressor-like protein